MGAVALLVGTAISSRAAFHLWNIREVYTDASGTRQFIEFHTASSSQQFVNGLQVQVRNTNNTITRTVTLTNNLPGDTANKAFLIATAAADASGAPAPDFTIPPNFLFPEGGSISFFGANSGPYTALPTDGTLSLTWNGGFAANSPVNFSGSAGFVVVPASPPTVVITAPANNAVVAALASMAVSVSAADSDGTVASVRLLTNGVPAATNTVAPFGFNLSNLGAGNHTLVAIARDNASLTGTSAPVVIRAADQPVLVSGPGASGPVAFQFNSRAGVDYVVERSTSVSGFSGIATNAGTGGTLQFQETEPASSQRSYRVRLQ